MEDTLLIWQFKRGSNEALRRIYEKYESDMLAVAINLAGDVHTGHDIVHDVVVSFAQSRHKLKLAGNLKSFLLTCVVNGVRDELRAKRRTFAAVNEQAVDARADEPVQAVIATEDAQRLAAAMAELPYEQREVVLLHLRGGMNFKAIARLQDISINTVQSRYRYGLEKLRSLLDSEVEK
jgi:RNA polymerase sigma-70 factor (ECF subfamily)